MELKLRLKQLDEESAADDSTASINIIDKWESKLGEIQKQVCLSKELAGDEERGARKYLQAMHMIREIIMQKVLDI